MAEPDSVKLCVGVLYSDQGKLNQARGKMESLYGQTDYQSETFPFTVTDYYQEEMGEKIYRLFLSFPSLISPGEIARIKLETNGIEEELAFRGKRRVNLDPGYMDYNKVVLASNKYNGQKIYLNSGIYADLTLYYEKGRFHPYPWSFPDFKSGQYNPAFLRIRELYKAQRRGNPVDW
jgi:hypothetical protein